MKAKQKDCDAGKLKISLILRLQGHINWIIKLSLTTLNKRCWGINIPRPHFRIVFVPNEDEEG